MIALFALVLSASLLASAQIHVSMQGDVRVTEGKVAVRVEGNRMIAEWSPDLKLDGDLVFTMSGSDVLLPGAVRIPTTTPSKSQIKSFEASKSKVNSPASTTSSVTTNTVRENMMKMGAPSNIPQFLASQIGVLKTMKLSNTVPDKDALIKVLAQDMKEKDGGLNPDDTYQRKAAKYVSDNNAVALTTSQDMFYSIAGVTGTDYDEVHELCHILSGQGGASKLHEFRPSYNEGAINFFSELITQSPYLNPEIQVQDRYISETAIIRDIIKLITGESAITDLYKTTFLGDINAFPRAVAIAYLKKGLHNNYWSERGWDEEIAITEWTSKLHDWNTTWMKQRLMKASKLY